MSKLNDIGNLMYLYLDNIEPDQETNASDFLIKASANLLNQKGGKNWVPIIVKEIADDKYQVIGNSFVYAVAEQAKLERVWCIIADDSPDTLEIVKTLSSEKIPKINLSKASREEIKSALEYLIEQPNSPLKTVNLIVATNRIDEASRRFWTNLDPITNLKCGITKGKKLDVLKQVFYLIPEAKPQVEIGSLDLQTMNVASLRKVAKEKGLAGYSKMKKADLLKFLS
jgi:Rho termination factor, N-terminal domain